VRITPFACGLCRGPTDAFLQSLDRPMRMAGGFSRRGALRYSTALGGCSARHVSCDEAARFESWSGTADVVELVDTLS
jgi:hypothetical protein